MTSFSGPAAVDVFGMLALASGLRLYAKTGMQPNRCWRSTAMMRTASAYTGQKFKARDYLGAADALTAAAHALRANLPDGNSITARAAYDAAYDAARAAGNAPNAAIAAAAAARAAALAAYDAAHAA